MNNSLLEILLIGLLIVANGWLVLVEIALIKARKARLHVMARAGNPFAQSVLDLVNQPSRILSTLQIGVTLIGILTGALGGVSLADNLTVILERWQISHAIAAPAGVAIVVIGITFFSLLIGELIPKQIAFRHAEAISVAFVRPVRLLMIILFPFVRILSFLSDSFLRLFGLTQSTTVDVTEEEVKVMVEHGTKTGVFEDEEREMFEGALGLANTRIAALMTPRVELDWINLSETEEQSLERIAASQHKRFPVARGDLDHVLGIIHTKEIFSHKQNDQPIDFTAFIHEPLYLPSTASALEALRQFKTMKTHIALIVDEHGTLLGLLTTNDLVEAVLGELPTSNSPEKLSIIQRTDGSWLVDGLITITEFKEYFGIDELPMEKKKIFHTLAGFIVSNLGKIPEPTDTVEWNEWKWEVVDMDNRRVDKVLVIRDPSKLETFDEEE